MNYVTTAPPGWDSVGPIAPSAVPVAPTAAPVPATTTASAATDQSLQDMLASVAMGTLGLTPSPSKKVLSPSNLVASPSTTAG